MTRAEFVEAMAYLEAGCQKTISKAAADVYFDALSDLSIDVLRFACKLTIMEHKYATFPSVAEIREFAAQAMRPGDMTEGEAWAMAWGAAKNIDPKIGGSYRVYRQGNGTYTEYASQLEYECSKLPPRVLQAMKAFGIYELCQAEKPDVARAQFQAIYRGLAERDRRADLLPAEMKADLAKIRERIANTTNKIGGMPE